MMDEYTYDVISLWRPTETGRGLKRYPRTEEDVCLITQKPSEGKWKLE